jgi:hypothetical protein
VEATCGHYQLGTDIYQLSPAFNSKPWFELYVLFSFLGLLWLVYVIWAYKEFRVHPMSIFFLLAVFESSQGMVFLTLENACHLGLPQLMCWTILWQPASYYYQN